MPKSLATLWRDDGTINYIVPPVIAANTFLVLAASHSPWLCYLMEDMAVVLQDDDLPEKIREQYHVTVESLRDGLAKRHDTQDHESRMQRGTDDQFPGMLYGTMHPSELASLADDLVDVVTAVKLQGGGDTESGALMLQAWLLWVNGAKKFVRPHEAMGPLWIGGLRE